jgi:hypothetical protein
MEFPEPYHSLPIREWRKYMKAHPKSYATIGVRAWLRNRHKYRLVCRENAGQPSEIQSPLRHSLQISDSKGQT